MHSKAKPPTKAEKRRIERIVELGCVACRKSIDNPAGFTLPACLPPAEVHHLLDGGKRRGHACTVGLCRWHHRGDRMQYAYDTAGMTTLFGPSLYHDAKEFHKRYGTDDELLVYQNELLADPPQKSEA